MGGRDHDHEYIDLEHLSWVRKLVRGLDDGMMNGVYDQSCS